MATSDDGKTVVISKRELRGNRLRFLMLTPGPKEEVAETLTWLVSPLASFILGKIHGEASKV